ncbi:MAG: PBSX family phage terminase large subunit, partial [Bacteroidaceae bacterium]|nr:PBSX family phage terminase large subunit [Bacteroidaceae bacterium]
MPVPRKRLNPNAFYLLWEFSNPATRYIVLYGGSSSGKSFSAAQAILLQTLSEKENTLVMRKVGASISKTIYEDFKVAAGSLGITHKFRFVQNSVKCLNNDAKIDFSGLDDSEKIKGISNYKRVLLEELSEYDEQDFKQIRLRLRGKEGQQIITTFNPISEEHWIKKKWLDTEELHDVPMECGTKIPKELCVAKSVKRNSPKTIINARTGEMETHEPDMLVVQTTYLNNFWVVGSPDGTYGYYDEHCIANFEHDKQYDPDYYNVYALGEWGILRTGGEFFSSFNRGRNCGAYPYDSSLPVHLSVDNNVLPYISIQFWQISYEQGKRVWQFGEITAEAPNNTVRRAAKLASTKLKEIGVDAVIIHGDASTRSANTIDEEKRSFLDLFIATLQENGIYVTDNVGNKNPSVALTGEFLNAIFEGLIDDVEVKINDACNVSITDYLSVQKDSNGAIYKQKARDPLTKQSYEKHGHFSDCMRYVCHDLLSSEYVAFSNRRKRNLFSQDGAIHYFNPTISYEYTDSLLYVMPDVCGMFVMIEAWHIGENWHIRDIHYRQTASVTEMISLIASSETGECFVECAKAYFQMVRELREQTEKNVLVVKTDGDYQRRIAATSDFIASNVFFSSKMIGESDEYAAFMESILDYRQGSHEYGASAALSGLA